VTSSHFVPTSSLEVPQRDLVPRPLPYRGRGRLKPRPATSSDLVPQVIRRASERRRPRRQRGVKSDEKTRSPLGADRSDAPLEAR
jgi:hypothetical protein